MISIILPIKNRHLFIKKCLQSIIKQESEFEELIIIDDKADIDHVKYIKKFLLSNLSSKKYKIVKNLHVNNNAGSARDFGINIAKQDYIAFIDDDDIWPDNYLKSRKKLILENKCFFSASPYAYFDEELNYIREIKHKNKIFNKSDFLLKNPIANSTVIIKKSLIIKAGGYSHLFKRNDFATWLNILNFNDCHYFNEIENVKVLRRKGSLSSKKYTLLIYQFKAFREGKLSIINSIIFTLIFTLKGIIKSLKRHLSLSLKK